jgi:hypothetical protein
VAKAVQDDHLLRHRRCVVHRLGHTHWEELVGIALHDKERLAEIAGIADVVPEIW